VTALYVFTNAGLGLFAATIARNIAELGLLAILMVVPLIMLSGTWTPPEAMPAWIRIGTFISPMRHYVDVSYGILLKDAGIDVLWDSVLAMALLGGVVFGFGVWRFRRQFG
jgi:ABC-2 type transport system permease protein